MSKTIRYKPDWWHRGYWERKSLGGGRNTKHGKKSWFFRNKKWFKELDVLQIGHHKLRSKELWFWD